MSRVDRDQPAFEPALYMRRDDLGSKAVRREARLGTSQHRRHDR
jgi:hypothetical protein